MKANPKPKTDIVVYNGSPLERRNLELIILDKAPVCSSINLASDVFASQYGVIGFLIVDYNPKKGRGYWDGGDYGWSMSEEHWSKHHGYFMHTNDPNDLRAKCKNVEIPGTLKIVRYFIMPNPSVKKLFNVKSLVRENLIPDDWWGNNSWDEHKVPFSGDDNRRYREIIECIGDFAKWEYETWPGEDHFAYQSFHLMQDYPVIREAAIESIVKALTRLDVMIARMDISEQFQKIDLDPQQGRTIPQLYLPGK